MKSRTNLWMMLAVCLLGAFIWLFERETPSTAEREATERNVLQLTPEEVIAISVQLPDAEITCRKQKDGWVLVKPVDAAADPVRIDHLLSILESLPRIEVVSSAEQKRRGLALADYGLTRPRARFVLVAPADRQEIVVGGASPLPGILYVRVPPSGDIIATRTNILDAIPKSAADWRSRNLFSADPDQIRRVEIARRGGGILQLARTGQDWFIEAPSACRADGRKVAQWLDSLLAVKVAEFVSDAKSPDPNAYGFGPDDTWQASIWVEGSETVQRLLVGKASDNSGARLYARLADMNAVYAIGRNAVDILSVGVADLRDRRVFTLDPARVTGIKLQEGEHKLALQKNADGWSLTEPAQVKADDETVSELALRLTTLQVESFLDPSETNLDMLGLQPPALVVELGAEALRTPPEGRADKGPALAAPAEVLLIGSRIRKGDRLAARVAGESAIFELSASAVRTFSSGVPARGLRCTDPMMYRDRGVLSLNPGSIRSITRRKAGREQRVERDGVGDWKPGGDSEGAVDAKAVAQVLAAASGLRALRIEEDHVRNLPSYGLDDSGVAITFGLTGTEGIQKKLILGFPARSDGIYAMVQGQDMIFALDKRLAGLLSQDLMGRQAEKR